MGCTLLWVKLGNAFAYFVVSFYKSHGTVIQYKYLIRVYLDYKTKLFPIVPGRHGKYIFTQESFYLQGHPMISMTSKKSFLDCTSTG